MIIAPHSDSAFPGTWRRLQDTKDGHAVFICPQGHPCSLSDYQVLPDGSVHPAVLCPECGFHRFIKLKDWSAVPTPLPVKKLDAIGR